MIFAEGEIKQTMVYSENAKIIEAQELKEIIEEEYSNPTVERMMFIETRERENIPGKVFPCYLEAWAYDEESKEEEKKLMFQLCIMQCTGGSFGLIRAVIHEKELGINKRIWDKPPTKGLREHFPFVEGVEQ